MKLKEVLDTPKYETDGCENCIFLGRYNKEDLYICISDTPTVISRYGNEEYEYSSGMVFAEHGLFKDPTSNLTEALKRAKNHGIVDVKITVTPKKYIVNELNKGI